MRRRDREMGRDFALEVIDQAPYGVLSVADGTAAYGIPLSFARQGDTLYFHSAKEGRKVDLLQDGTRVHLVFVSHCQVPEVMTAEEAEKAASDPARFSQLVSRLFTTGFASAMAEGRVRVLRTEAEKTQALRLVCEKYTPRWMAYFPQAISSGLKRTAVYAVDIVQLTAKRKQYDEQGQEMKGQQPV